MPALLVTLDDGPSIVLDKPILLIGRHPECDIQIESRKVSRRHCCIAQVSDYLVVRDLGSTNGIRINGASVVEGRLTPGDELTIGNHRYRVKWDAAPTILQVPPPARDPTVRAPFRVTEVEDELLESCEEPMPLDEPAAPLFPAPLPSHRGEEPFLLPDDLELMPNSDHFPHLSPHSSGSHPSL